MKSKFPDGRDDAIQHISMYIDVNLLISKRRLMSPMFTFTLSFMSKYNNTTYVFAANVICMENGAL